jgi:hypothetical protein
VLKAKVTQGAEDATQFLAPGGVIVKAVAADRVVARAQRVYVLAESSRTLGNWTE